jgi:hypothetical protein
VNFMKRVVGVGGRYKSFGSSGIYYLRDKQ